jgi:hypothetical protein
MDSVDSAWQITGPWCWACRIGANRKESCRGLSCVAASDTKGPSRGGKNWRHNPPRSSAKYFAFCSLCQALFAFYSLIFACENRLVHPTHTAPLSRLCASTPQRILFVREDPRATVPTSTVASLCVRSPGLGVSLYWSNAATAYATATSTATVPQTTVTPASCPAGGPVITS